MAINKLRAFCNTNSTSSVGRRHDIDFLLIHTFDFNLLSISIILVRRSFDSSSIGIVFLDFGCCVISIVRITSPYDTAISGFAKQTPIAIINVVQNMDLIFMQSRLNASIKNMLHIWLFKIEDEVFKDDNVGIWSNFFLQ